MFSRGLRPDQERRNQNVDVNLMAKKKSINPWLILGVVAAGTAMWFMSKPSVESMKKHLFQFAPTGPWDSMSDTEIEVSYKYVKNYVEKGQKITATDPLYATLVSVSQKYNIFT